MTKIFKQEEICEAAYKSRQFDDGLFPNWSDANIWDGGFIEGVRFTESKVEEIAIEFATYILQDKLLFSEDLFKQFLKERNNG
jgi:hypothetical protein